MSYYLIGDSGTVAFVPFDGVLEAEDTTYSNKATSNPIEGGGSINDHAISDPVKLSLSGIVTAAPGAQATLVAMAQHRDLLSYRGVDAYDNMLITSLAISRGKDTGADAFAFRISLQQMDVTGAVIVPVSAPTQMRSADRGAPTAAKGAKDESNVGLVTASTGYAAYVDSFNDPQPQNSTNARNTAANRGY